MSADRAPADPVIVVGGGIAGLAAAWELQRDGMAVRLVESADRVGGKLRTTPFAGRLVDEAADAFLARVPHGVELARELGLEDELIAPATSSAQVWTEHGLQRLPTPNVLGIPLDAMAAEAMLGAEAARAIEADLARTIADPIRPGETIGSLVRRRLGDVVHEALVDPLIGAINAGDTDRLDLRASSPQLLAAAEASPSLVEGFRRMRAGRASDAPVFHSFESGMSRLVDALADCLGSVIECRRQVVRIASRSAAEVEVEVADGSQLVAPAVVVATPSATAARLLGDDFAHAAHAIDAIPMVSVTLVSLAWPGGTLDLAGDLSGFVVPRNRPELTITACSFASAKWPHLAGADGDIDMVRVSVGHAGDQHTPTLPDDELLDLVRRDLAVSLGVTHAPIAHRVSRWPAAFPQYEPGHGDRLAAIEGELNPAGIFLAGMSYRGIGVPANIDQGRTAAVSAILHVLEGQH